MTAILGISAFYHDSAACLVVDGHIVAAAQEERFSRIKHDASFPLSSIRFCLEQANLTQDQIDYVGFYEKPFTKLERILETHLDHVPRGFHEFARAMPVWMKQKLWHSRLIRQGTGFSRRPVFAEHHLSHAASAFFPSPFEQSAIVVIDGVGEKATTTIASGRGNQIELLEQINFPDSLGLFFATFTAFCGFRVNGGEGKLMGLAPYGQPRFEEQIEKEMLEIFSDGSFRLKPEYFRFGTQKKMHTRKLEEALGVKPRTPESEINSVYLDLAASVQKVTEKRIQSIVCRAKEITNCQNLCLAGGVALNCVANRNLADAGGFHDIWIQPAAGDSGGALGVALLIWHQLLNQPRIPCRPDAMQGSLLGPTIQTENVQCLLDELAVDYHQFDSDQEVDRAACKYLKQGRVIGWCQGRMEFGPRALGNRSILADPRRADMQSRINEKVKRRENFRPFAPAILAEDEESFDWPKGSFLSSRYMLVTCEVAAGKRLVRKSHETGLDQLHQVRSKIPAVTHVDFSARTQRVDPQTHPRFHELLTEFQRQSDCPMLVNTSLNVRGEPLVNTAADALRCFAHTELDALVLDRLLIEKEALHKLALEDWNRLSEYRTESAKNGSFSHPAKEKIFTAAHGLAITLLTCSLCWKFEVSLAMGIGIASLMIWATLVLILVPGWSKAYRQITMRVVLAINRVLTRFLLLIMFATLICPIGWLRILGQVLRKRNRDPAQSNWKPACTASSSGDYFRQYIRHSNPKRDDDDAR